MPVMSGPFTRRLASRDENGRSRLEAAQMEVVVGSKSCRLRFDLLAAASSNPGRSGCAANEGMSEGR
jgi:hypothetical protein